MLSFTKSPHSVSSQPQNQTAPQDHQNAHQQMGVHPPQLQQQQPTMRLRDSSAAITPAARSSRKRKTPPSVNTDAAQQNQPPPPPQHVLPPPHTLVHPPHMQGPPPLPPGYAYAPADYTPGGLPPPHPSQLRPPPGSEQQPENQSAPTSSATGRALSNSKRAEQNRKAQRAFRERRDQHVKTLESRSQLLDTALASADEANRRWEECRNLVDQLRIENAALRAALTQAQMMNSNMANSGGVGRVATPPAPVTAHSVAHLEEAAKAEGGKDGGPEGKADSQAQG